MYIGPWQEYSLSKQRASQRQRGNINYLDQSQPVKSSATPEIRKEIENALLNSLDPSAAQVAMQAMDSYFKQKEQPAPTIETAQIPNARMQIPRQRQQDRRRQAGLNALNLSSQGQASPLTLLDYNNSAQSARSNGSRYAASPLSVRTSKSEPTAKLPSLMISNLSSNQNQSIVSTRTNQSNNSPLPLITTHNSVQTGTKPTEDTKAPPQSSYDSVALVNFLKMERNEKAKQKIAQLAGWSAANQPSQTSKPKKTPEEVALEEKLEQIKQMKTVYMSKINEMERINSDSLDNAIANHTVSTMQSKPMQTTSINNSVSILPKQTIMDITPEPTPRVVDKEITDQDLLRVSKYFSSESFHQIASNIPNNSKSHVNRNKKILTMSDDLESPAISHKGFFNDDIESPFVPPPQSKSRSELHSSGQTNEAYTGNIDGLLSWTRSLNVDL